MDYKVRFINYPKQYHLLKGEVDGAILRCLESGDLILREDLQKFERDFANFCNRKYCVTTDSCTGAMFLSLCAAGVGRGDEVITVSHTYIATIDVIVHCGATPVLVDVGNDFNMDMSLLEKAITPKTKAILPVHLNGRMCDMKYLMEVAEKHGLTVVEDCAQAPGAEYTGRMAGSFGLTGCFSFYPSKVLGSFGDGGALVTDDEDLADRLYLLRDHGERPKYRGDSAGKIPFYGFNSLLDNLQAAVLTVKLKHLPEYIKKRRELASRYDKGLKDLPLFLPPVPSHSQYFDVFQNYVVRAAERDRLRGYLTKNGVETLCQWPIPNHLQEGLGLKHFKLPVTERLSKEVVSLPMCVELEDDEVDYIVGVIRDFYRN